MRLHYVIFVVLAAAFLLAAGPSVRAEEAKTPPFELQDGDRVAFIGDAFTERQQANNYLEGALTATFAKQNLSFRNLGWSGDTVFGEARAVFGKAPEGFARLMKDLTEGKPTVVVVCYGANEANAGAAGLAGFTAGYEKLLTELAKLNARIVLLSPVEREKLAAPLPDPAEYNRNVALYAKAISEIAAKRNLPYYSLLGIVPAHVAAPKPLDQLTDNGIHFSPYGYWRITPVVFGRLGMALPPWSVKLNAADGKGAFAGVTVSDVKVAPQAISFTALDAALPLGAPPAHSPAGAEALAPEQKLTITGLAPGKYELKADGQTVATATHEQWATGIQLTAGPEFAQADALRAAINVKNQYYFHRYRPENETYLFLFRKHEQGNNAVEIPQFDPLILEKEKEIATLRQPKPHTYTLTKLP